MFRPGYSDNGPERRGEFKGYTGGSDSSGRIVTVHLAGDPYSVCVYEPRIRPATEKESTQMPTATVKPKAKDLRRQAKALGIEGWEDMSLDELIEAVDEAQEDEDEPTPAKKATTKKSTSKSKSKVVDDDDEEDDDEDEEDDDEDSDEDSDEDDEDTDDDEDEEDEVPVAKKSTAKKAVASKSKSSTKPAAKKAAPAKAAKKSAPAPREREIAENGNPYPAGSNLHYMAELLIKGGKLGVIVKKVNAKLTINARAVDRDDEETFKEWHRRVVICSQNLRNKFDFTEEKEGRGLEATIRLVPPA